MPAHRQYDLSGQPIGQLVVLHEVPRKPPDPDRRWLCLCACGVTKDIRQTALLKGQQSCGCLRSQPKKHHLAGERFGRLLVIDEAPRLWYKKRAWNCLCDCGTPKVVEQGNLLNGFIESCGCLKSPPILERFWGQVDIRGPNDCWPWLGKCGDTGYGHFAVTHRKFMQASRFAYEITYGPILFPDLLVCHRCDNPPCCNAERHHFLDTALGNMADARRKGRLAYGTRNGNAVFTPELVRWVRQLARTTGYAEIARLVGSTPENISNICRRRTWASVT